MRLLALASCGTPPITAGKPHEAKGAAAHAQAPVCIEPGRRALLTGSAALALTAAAQPAQGAIKPFCGVSSEALPPWAYTTPWVEDVVNFGGNQIWWRRVGKEAKGGFLRKETKKPLAPLLVLHGGPGIPSRYLETLELIAGLDRQVIFYDQGGCGRSGKSYAFRRMPGGFTVGYFEEELRAIRRDLGLERVHILGHGWGGMLALSHLGASGGEGVLSMTLESVPASYRELVAARRARAERMPADVRDALLGGQPGEEAYEAAFTAYASETLCRSSYPIPGCLGASLSARARDVDQDLAGGQYFSAAGGLEGWEAGEVLGGVQVPPTLLMGGRFGEVAGQDLRALRGTIPGAALIEHAEAGDCAHIDAWEPFLTAVNDHLSAHDQ